MAPRGPRFAVVVAGAALGALAACSDVRPRPDAGTSTVSVHPAGILDPQSTDFHGKELQRLNWDFSVCGSCHGNDFSGGTAKKSCLTCHAEGPTACTTCHGAGPTSNAHVIHRQVAKLDCSECHVVPAHWDDEGHILNNGAAITTPPRVVFGARAGFTLDPGDRTAPPVFQDGKCSNVYCHGAVLHAAGGVATAPRWDDPTPAGACDRCHGAPPPSHAQSNCATCHPASAPHIDGAVQVGRSSGCSGCHGDATSPAPPTDLSGNTLTTAIGVGAHRAHLLVPSGLRGPIPCTTCHNVPTQIDDAGHIDSPPPAEVVGNDPRLGLFWDRTSQTCISACHSAARPVWTTQGGVFCGSCHGIPPTGAPHTSTMTLSSCAACHPQTMNAAGNLILTTDPAGVVTSKHINGVVDVQ